MASALGENSPSAMTVFGVLGCLIAVVGTSVLGWEWGADFGTQPIPYVLGACAAIVAITITVRKRT